MLRFLKWIFFIFGGLGLIIMSFFYIQNKTDLHLYFDNKSSLEYETIKSSCLNTKDEYYFECFYKRFDNYLRLVSLSGTSLGLKSAFTFIDSDKSNNKRFKGVENDVRFGLNHLRINNLALQNATARFHGIQFTYGGYIGKIKDFKEKGQSFSEGIITGLKSKDGIQGINDSVKKAEYFAELEEIETQYQEVLKSIDLWLEAQIKTLKEKHNID